MCASADRAPKLFRKPPPKKNHERVCLLKEHDWGWIQVRLEIRKWEDPTVKAAAAAALRQSVAGWMGVCLALGSGWGEALVCPRPGSVRERAADRLCSWTPSDSGLIPGDFFFLCSLLVWFASVPVSTEENCQCALLDWFALSDAAPLCAPTPRHTNPPGSCLLPLTDISDRRIYVKAKSHCVSRARKKKKRKVDQGIFFSSSSSSSLCRRLSAVARSSPWRDTWFPLSKRRSSFVKRLWIFFFFFFLERLLLSPHGCPQFKRSRLRRLSCGLYYLRSRMWNEAVFTRPRKSNILTLFASSLTLPHQRYARWLPSCSQSYVSLCGIRVQNSLCYRNLVHACSRAVIYSAAFIVYILSVLH